MKTAVKPNGVGFFSKFFRAFDRVFWELLSKEFGPLQRGRLSAIKRERRRLIGRLASKLHKEGYGWETIASMLNMDLATCWRWAQGDEWRLKSNELARREYAERRDWYGDSQARSGPPGLDHPLGASATLLRSRNRKRNGRR